MRERSIWTRKAVKMRVLRAKMEDFVKESIVAVSCAMFGLLVVERWIFGYRKYLCGGLDDRRKASRGIGSPSINLEVSNPRAAWWY